MRIETNAADYRHSVEIQHDAGESKDATGAPTENWTKKYTVPAAIWPYRGKEFAADGRLISQGLTKIRMRYRSGITQAMRIVYDSRTFEIMSMVNVEERNIVLEFICKENI